MNTARHQSHSVEGDLANSEPEVPASPEASRSRIQLDRRLLRIQGTDAFKTLPAWQGAGPELRAARSFSDLRPELQAIVLAAEEELGGWPSMPEPTFMQIIGQRGTTLLYMLDTGVTEGAERLCRILDVKRRILY